MASCSYLLSKLSFFVPSLNVKHTSSKLLFKIVFFSHTNLEQNHLLRRIKAATNSMAADGGVDKFLGKILDIMHKLF